MFIPKIFSMCTAAFMLLVIVSCGGFASTGTSRRLGTRYNGFTFHGRTTHQQRISLHSKRSLPGYYKNGYSAIYTPGRIGKYTIPIKQSTLESNSLEERRLNAIARFKINEKRRLQQKIQYSLINRRNSKPWWGSWSTWTSCSRTCGKGVQFQKRHCLGLNPVYPNKKCEGDTKKVRLCNTNDCPSNSQSFREMQCAQHSAKVVYGRNSNWRPYGYPEDEIVSSQPCQIVCVSHKNEFQINTVAFDGTECRRGWHPGRCAEGECMLIGCDGLLGSDNLRDKCGECNTNTTSSCSVVEGIFSKHVVRSGLYKIVTIPTGAYDIIVTERRRTPSRLMIKDMNNNTLLDGSSNAQNGIGADGWPSNIMMAGSELRYRRPLPFSSNEGFEYALASDPINEPITFYIFAILSGFDQIYYEYKIRNTPVASVDEPSTSAIPTTISTTTATTTTTLTSTTTTTETPLTTTEVTPATVIKIAERIPESPFFNDFPVSKIQTDGIVKYEFLEEEEPPLHGKYADEDFITLRIANSDISLGEDETSTSHLSPSVKVAAPPPGFYERPTRLDDDKMIYEIASVFQVQKQLSSNGEDVIFLRDNETLSQQVAALEIVNTHLQDEESFNTTTAYRWRIQGYAPCSSTCENGVQDRYVICEREDDEEQVDEIYCDKNQKPFPVRRNCFRERCAPRWETTPWSVCSKSCGEGVQMRTARCWQMISPGFDSTVYIEKCNSIEELKPNVTKACVVKSKCGPTWATSEWTECNAKCGAKGVRRRTVRCSGGTRQSCDQIPPPSSTAWCKGPPCLLEWAVSEWGPCSGECGGGRKTRRVSCIDASRIIRPDHQCDRRKKPVTYHPCGNNNCRPEWITQDWGECSSSCGPGNKTRQVSCASVVNDEVQNYDNDEPCQSEEKPNTVGSCEIKPCDPAWLTTPWSKCSVTCGEGQKVRKVQCYLNDMEVEGCDSNTKPPGSEDCSMPDCPRPSVPSPDSCQDKRGVNCKLVKRLKLCKHWYYKEACCSQCNGSKR